MRDENNLEEKSKGKTREGANELLTTGDLQSHRKMFNLIRNTFPEVTVSTSAVAVRVSFSLHITFFSHFLSTVETPVILQNS